MQEGQTTLSDCAGWRWHDSVGASHILLVVDLCIYYNHLEADSRTVSWKECLFLIPTQVPLGYLYC